MSKFGVLLDLKTLLGRITILLIVEVTLFDLAEKASLKIHH